MNRSHLFKPFALGPLGLANRIVVSPMCQYSAVDGAMTDWHLIHLGQLALSGAGLLTIEATAVAAEGRITAGDLGLYSDAQEAAMARVLAGLRQSSPIPIGIQLSHAGRKASRFKPWEGGGQIGLGDPSGWTTVAPSAIAAAEDEYPPVQLDRAALAVLREAFGNAARRAARLGLDLIQLHAAHGYLLHGFLSPLTNHRDDEYGGSRENRMRFPLEIFDTVRTAVPSHLPVTVRISATDWVEGGWSMEDSIAFIQALAERGCAGIDVSSGGASSAQRIPVGPGYQVPLARAIKQATSLPVTAVGLITGFEQAEAIIGTGDADLVALARGLLYDPRWPWHAAAHLGASIKAPEQYLRCQPATFPGLFAQP